MTQKLQKLLRDKIKARISEKDVPNAVMADMSEAMERYSDLNSRAKDFAFRYAVSPYRSYTQWANYYGVSTMTIQNYMLNPRVRSLIEEIRYDSRKFLVTMQHNLVRDAMMQYKKIFNAPEDDGPSLEAKRKAAKEVLAWAGIGSDLDDEGKARAPGVSVNILGPHPQTGDRYSDLDMSQEITVDDIKVNLENLEKKQKLRQLAERYGEKD